MPRKNINTTLNIFKKWVLVALSLCATALFSLFYFSITGTVKGSGIVQASDEHLILAPYTGYIQQIYAQPNTPLQKGDTIAKIHSSDLKNELLALKDQINECQSQLHLRQAQLAATKLDPLPENLQNTQSEFNIAQKKMLFYQAEKKRFSYLRTKGSVSPAILQQKKLAYDEAFAHFQKQTHNLYLVKKGIGQRAIDTQEAYFKLAQAKRISLQNKYNRLNARIAKGLIIAPCDGTLLLQPLRVGESISKDHLVLCKG